LSSVGRR